MTRGPRVIAIAFALLELGPAWYQATVGHIVAARPARSEGAFVFPLFLMRYLAV
jgi:hypothetical protein